MTGYICCIKKQASTQASPIYRNTVKYITYRKQIVLILINSSTECVCTTQHTILVDVSRESQQQLLAVIEIAKETTSNTTKVKMITYKTTVLYTNLARSTAGQILRSWITL